MNSPKDTVAVVTDGMYVILGASEEHRLHHRQFPEENRPSCRPTDRRFVPNSDS
jgi:hypothetical protein